MTEQKIEREKRERPMVMNTNPEPPAKRQCSPYETEVKKHTEHISANRRRSSKLEIACNQAPGIHSIASLLAESAG